MTRLAPSPLGGCARISSRLCVYQTAHSGAAGWHAAIRAWVAAHLAVDIAGAEVGGGVVGALGLGQQALQVACEVVGGRCHVVPPVVYS